jgi:hypothetical protein
MEGICFEFTNMSSFWKFEKSSNWAGPIVSVRFKTVRRQSSDRGRRGNHCHYFPHHRLFPAIPPPPRPPLVPWRSPPLPFHLHPCTRARSLYALLLLHRLSCSIPLTLSPFRAATAAVCVTRLDPTLCSIESPLCRRPSTRRATFTDLNREVLAIFHFCHEHLSDARLAPVTPP